MKKVVYYLVAIVLVIGVGSAVAQESKEESPSKKECMKKCSCPMKTMMKSMLKTEVVATQDGGVVVRMGTKMVKYDKDLNEVKEVELKMDMEQIKNMLHEKMKDCPIRQKMMESGGRMQGGCPHKKMMKEESAQ